MSKQMASLNEDNLKIGIIGLGYVGLPLAVAFEKFYPVVGFDISQTRVDELCHGVDSTHEVTASQLKLCKNLYFSSNSVDLDSCNLFIVTVPTPVDRTKRPDLSPLEKASQLVGQHLNVGDIVIYESTVYPGATEEVCIPVLEKNSDLKFNQDFFVGYSPERINPGDKERTLATIVKITSGSNPEVANFIDRLYQKIITVGTFLASSIKVAEAAKVIENTQRDVNIGLINELALIFNRLDIDTEEVLKAAGTKWNFLPFRPGLVGGHCIGVDPYYLTHKAQEVGYQPKIIPASRRLNDNMGHYVAHQIARLMAKKRIHIVDSHVLVLGFGFKEDCPDPRNTKVIDIFETLTHCYNAQVDVFDPWVDKMQVIEEYGLDLITQPQNGFYNACVIAVAHKEFKSMGYEGIIQFLKPNHVIFDIKYVLGKDQSDGRL